MAVSFSSISAPKSNKSRETHIAAIEMVALKKKKDYIGELEAKLNDIMAANRQERITSGVLKKNIEEEIVRLNKKLICSWACLLSRRPLSLFWIFIIRPGCNSKNSSIIVRNDAYVLV